MRFLRSHMALAAALAMLSPIVPAAAQPALDRVLSESSVNEGQHCAVVKIGFHFPVQYESYFPQDSGTQLSIRLKAISLSDAAAMVGREGLRVPQSNVADITAIEFDGDRPDGPTLSITFGNARYYHIAQGSDFQGILISVSDTAANSACTPWADKSFASSAGSSPIAGLRPATTTPDRGTAAAAQAGAGSQALLDDARAAVSAKDYNRAIQLLTKFLQGPDNASMPAARELLGVAHERNNQGALAKAEYEQFLRDYPNDPSAGRVRQRLAALLNRALHPGEQSTAPGDEPPSLRWQANASLSEYFYHDEMSTSVHDEGAQITIDNGLTALQSELVSSLDGSISVTGADFQGRLRFSGSYTKDFLSGVNDRLRIGELYIEGSDASHTFFARIGRQYRSSGGVLGRIDGALATVSLNDVFKVDVIAGFPIDSTYSQFSTGRYAYGASVDYAKAALSGDVYVLRQIDDGFLDRQSVGAEGRYIDKTLSLYATLDYDVHFAKVNLALFNGNYIFDDQTSVNVSADYRRAPLLRTSDALFGQTVTSLRDLLSTYTRQEIEQLALDRTATSTSLFASVGHPLSEQFTASADATLWTMSGMPASGGVPAMPATGTQYYFSGHLTGTSLLTDGDLGMIGLGYSRMPQANRYTFDLNTRYPITHDLRVGPRLFFSYRDFSASSISSSTGNELIARPTLRLDYQFRPNVAFELDGGTQWQRDLLGTTTTQTMDYLVDFGVRIDY